MNDYSYSGTDFEPDRRARGDRRPDFTTTDSASSQLNDYDRPRKRRKPGMTTREEAESGLPRFISRPIAFFTSRKMKSVVGIALILLAAYLSVAALSFLKNSGTDQSEVVTQTVEQMAQTQGAVENIAGPTGAKTSHHLFVEGLGLGSVVLIVYMVVLGLGLLGLKKINFWSLTFKSLIFAITISFVLGLLSINSTANIPPGGYHGRYINILLISRIGWIGAFIVSCMLVAVLVTIYIAELTRFYQKSREKIRIVQAKKIHEQDRKVYEQEVIDTALANGPINVVVKESEDEKPAGLNTHTSDNDRRQKFDNIESKAAFDNDDRYSTRAKEPAANAGRMDDNAANATVQKDSAPEDNSLSSPGFEINAASEIEQANHDDSALRLQGPYDPRAELSRYRMPTLDLLHDRPRKTNSVDLSEQEENKERITKTLNDYGIQIVKIEATVGPTVTLYEIIPAEGVRLAYVSSRLYPAKEL